MQNKMTFHSSCQVFPPVGYRLLFALCFGVGAVTALGSFSVARAANFPELGERCYKGLQGHPGKQVSSVAHTIESLGHGDRVSHSWPVGRKRKVIRDLMALEQLADIEVVRFEKEKAELLIIGPAAVPGQGLRFEEWHAIFRAIAFYGPPGVSIDPGPTPDHMVVSYYGGIEATAAGASFFAADVWLKQLSTRYHNLTCTRLTLELPSLPSELDLMITDVLETGRAAGQRWHRYWFEPSGEHVEVSADGLAMRIPAKRLIVKQEMLTPHSQAVKSARLWAQAFSEHFDEIATAIPSSALVDLYRQSALVYLSKWMVDQGLPIDERWLESDPPVVPTPRTTPSITVTKTARQGNLYVQVGIYGGVDFQKPNTYGLDTGFVARTLHASARAEPPGKTSWGFSLDGRSYQATRLPYTQPVILRKARAD